MMKLSVVLSLGIFAACGSPAPASTPPPPSMSSSASTGAMGSTGATAVKTLTCLQVLQCVAECADVDTTCPDTCIGKASAEGDSKLSALVMCLENESCQDAECAQSKCAPSLTACLQSSAPEISGPALTGTVPAGNVPADLVGEWTATTWGDTDTLTLNADGTAVLFNGVVSDSKYCAQRITVTSSGTAVVGTDTIVLYATSVVNQVKPCDGNLETTNGPAIQIELSYSRQDATTLIIVEAACVAMHPTDAQAFCNLVLHKK